MHIEIHNKYSTDFQHDSVFVFIGETRRKHDVYEWRVPVKIVINHPIGIFE